MVTTVDAGVKTVRYEAELESALSPNWNKVPGVLVNGRSVSVDPETYFFRFENPSWLLCDWDRVRAELLDNLETEETSFEQQTLDFVRRNGYRTEDGGEVLKTAQRMYSYIFRQEHLEDPDLGWVTPRHLRILQEMGTIMALNRVELTGHISNVGPAWFFPLCSEKVFELDKEEAGLVDELYHGTFFNESRRVESVKAHAALGGRLVHGCHSVPNQSGGCVVNYGTDIEEFRLELQSFKSEWMDTIRAF